MNQSSFLNVVNDGPVLRIWLNRPDVRNAFNPTLIRELSEVFGNIKAGGSTRVVVLAGMGKVFCAGADLNWMREMAGYSAKENYADARNLAAMLSAIDLCPVPVVGRVQRAAYGGALGLLACCDSVIATSDCTFAFSEVRLGISPATIAPYVVAKIGASGARDLFLSGERFDAQRALSMGLVHQIVEPEQLDAAVEAKLAELLQAAPIAASETKNLISQLTSKADEHTVHATAELIAKLRAAPEGQEGLSAFLEKRKPSWQEPGD
jgi:methylglutaconyl-CoA hydratase